MRKYVLLKIEMATVSDNGNIRHCARSAFRHAPKDRLTMPQFTAPWS